MAAAARCFLRRGLDRGRAEIIWSRRTRLQHPRQVVRRRPRRLRRLLHLRRLRPRVLQAVRVVPLAPAAAVDQALIFPNSKIFSSKILFPRLTSTTARSPIANIAAWLASRWAECKPA